MPVLVLYRLALLGQLYCWCYRNTSWRRRERQCWQYRGGWECLGQARGGIVPVGSCKTVKNIDDTGLA